MTPFRFAYRNGGIHDPKVPVYQWRNVKSWKPFQIGSTNLLSCQWVSCTNKISVLNRKQLFKGECR